MVGAKAAIGLLRATPAKIAPMSLPKLPSFQRFFVPLLAAGLVALAYRSYGWPGVAGALGALVMWVLLHFTRMLQVMQRAAKRPKGYVDSAVMLNAKLRAGMTLLHVVALTRALGTARTALDEQPEVFCWTDGSGSEVSCEFSGGRLKKWTLVRPGPEESVEENHGP